MSEFTGIISVNLKSYAGLGSQTKNTLFPLGRCANMLVFFSRLNNLQNIRYIYMKLSLMGLIHHPHFQCSHGNSSHCLCGNLIVRIPYPASHTFLIVYHSFPVILDY